MTDAAGYTGQSRLPDGAVDPEERQPHHYANTPANAQSSSHHHHPRPKQKHVVGGAHRSFARVPSAKALAKYHHAQPPSKLTRRNASPSPPASSHRRAHSDVKLTRDSSSSNLKRNRSHVEVSRRTKSSEKLKGLAAAEAPSRARKERSLVFELGIDDQDDEWVDASGTESQYLGMKGVEEGEVPLGEKMEHKALPTRLSADYGKISPELTDETGSGQGHQGTPDSSRDVNASGTPLTAGAAPEGLTSRFLAQPTSGSLNDGSFYKPQHPSRNRTDSGVRRPRSLASMGRSSSLRQSTPISDDDESEPSGRYVALPAEKSRTQQKLDLQRASSVIEPGHSVAPGVVGASPLVGIGGPGYDGGASRDPRVGRLLERTGMEYLVVRRYQNPVARSLERLTRIPGNDKTRRIPRADAGTAANGILSSNYRSGHGRNVSLGDHGDGRRERGADRDRDNTTNRRPTTPAATSIRTNGRSSFETDERERLSERMSGESALAAHDDDGTTALLRNLWEKTTDLSTSQE